MLVESEFLKGYLVGAVKGSPAIVGRLLYEISDEEADRRPDPERFTIREVVAHLAGWEPVFQDRIRRTLAESEPTLPVIDPEQLAIDGDYAHTDLADQFRLFTERREQTVEMIDGLTAEQWQRIAHRPNVGQVTLESLVALMPLHDVYHMRQIAEWRQK